MIRIISILSLILFITACGSSKKEIKETPQVIVGPQVQNWMDKTSTSSQETLGVLISAKEEIKDIKFIRKINQNYYTGRVTVEQLKQLITDPRIERISTGMTKPLNQGR